MIYPLKMVMFIIVIVDLPIENGGSFHSYVNVYPRVVARMPFLSPSHITRCRWAKWASMTFRCLGASPGDLTSALDFGPGLRGI